MRDFLLRWGISALGLWVATRLVAGFTIEGASTLTLAALMLGLVNATVRPLLVVLTLPLTLATLGLFLLVINAGMLALVAALLDDFRVAGFGSALLGWLVVSVTSWLASGFLGTRVHVKHGDR